MSHKPLAEHLLDALMDAGSWMSRTELGAVRDCSAVALDDALADLMAAEKVHYRKNVGYRLAATAVCRLAAQKRRRDRVRASVVGVPAKDGYRLGIAEERAGLGVVMYELALPLAGTDEDPHVACQRMVNKVIDFVNARGDSTCVNK